MHVQVLCTISLGFTTRIACYVFRQIDIAIFIERREGRIPQHRNQKRTFRPQAPLGLPPLAPACTTDPALGPP